MTEKEKTKAYDNKIREAILNGLIDCRDSPDLGWSNFGGIHIDDCIDWLEKQDEQASSQTNERAWLYLVSDVLTWKDGIGQYLDDPRVQEFTKRLCNYYAQKLYNPSVLSNSSKTGKNEQQSDDKIESKFHKGDWITINKPCQIINIHDNGNYIVQYCDDENTHELSKNFCESYFHFWTIQDAKNGDVLEFGDHGRRVIGILSYINKTTGKVDVSCLLECNKFKVGVFYNLDTVKPHPVTKEQRDALIKAMNDAGYKWNTETKTLEKLVEPKFKVGDKIVNGYMKYIGAPGAEGTISKIIDDKYIFSDGSCMSISNQDSWELVQDRFDPKTLQPFDKVLVRDGVGYKWNADFYSYKVVGRGHSCVDDIYDYCIPYNDDTKHLLGTSGDAPDFYRYWED